MLFIFKELYIHQQENNISKFFKKNIDNNLKSNIYDNIDY